MPLERPGRVARAAVFLHIKRGETPDVKERHEARATEIEMPRSNVPMEEIRFPIADTSHYVGAIRKMVWRMNTLPHGSTVVEVEDITQRSARSYSTVSVSGHVKQGFTMLVPPAQAEKAREIFNRVIETLVEELRGKVTFTHTPNSPWETVWITASYNVRDDSHYHIGNILARIVQEIEADPKMLVELRPKLRYS